MQIFNTLTRQKEEFVPQVPGEYRIYVCGPTVYNYIHIGNARPLIVFDTLRRYLEYRGNKVIYVSNITDIDDKVILLTLHTVLGNHLVKLFLHYFLTCRVLSIRQIGINGSTYQEVLTHSFLECWDLSC